MAKKFSVAQQRLLDDLEQIPVDLYFTRLGRLQTQYGRPRGRRNWECLHKSLEDKYVVCRYVGNSLLSVNSPTYCAYDMLGALPKLVEAVTKY